MVVLNKQEKMFSSDRTGVLCVLKTRSPLPEDLRSGSNQAGCPRVGYLSSWGAGAMVREIQVSGQLPRKSVPLQPRKSLTPLASLSLSEGCLGEGMR